MDKLKFGLCAIGFAFVIALITAGVMECVDDRSALKREMLPPTPVWIERHGESFESVQAYNIAVLLNAERSRQNAKD